MLRYLPKSKKKNYFTLDYFLKFKKIKTRDLQKNLETNFCCESFIMELWIIIY